MAENNLWGVSIQPRIFDTLGGVANTIFDTETFFDSDSAPTDETLYIDKLTADVRNKIMIQGGGGTKQIAGFIDASMSFGANATWDNNMIGKDIGDSITSGYNNAIANSAGVGAIRMARNSMVTWQQSSSTALNFSVFILASDKHPNPLVEADKVWAYVLPERWGAGIMSTPGGYTVDIAGNQAGSVSIWIGAWFFAPNAFVVSNANVEVSKERVKGSANIPLWVKIDMVLTPNREFFAYEYEDFFIKGA